MDLSEALEANLNQRIASWQRADACDREAVESALAALYQRLGRERPAVLFCQSPYQLVTLPSLLIGLLHSDMWQVISHDFSSGLSGIKSGDRETDRIAAGDEEWKSKWDDAWTTLWVNGGYRLVDGMLRTSRLGRQFPYLDELLIERSKQELFSWFASGQLKRFESRLRREFYRQHWGLHLWSTNNFVGDQLSLTWIELRDELSHRLDELTDQKEAFENIGNRVLEVLGFSGTALVSLVDRMGAEPAAQLKSAVWMPFDRSSMVLAEMWKQLIDADAFQNHDSEFALWRELDSWLLAMVCLEEVVFVCEKPIVFSVDQRGRLHNETGPALSFGDGFTIYAWHDVVVERRVIEKPETITIEEIENASNVEIRRVLIERYGQVRYLEESGSEQIHEDETGVLYRKQIEGDEAIVMVKVINRTAEPDGTFREYFLRVPPDIATARQAVAWTFGYTDDQDYSPTVES